jgi:hypothetical protein
MAAEEHSEPGDESNGQSWTRAFSLIRHVGRKSGRIYETPVILVQIPE